MPSSHLLIVLFDVVDLLGIILLACALLPAVLSKTIQRSRVWYSMMVAWLVFALSYGLLVGRQEPPSQPPFGLCLVQTLLVYAVPPLVSTSTLCYFIEFYLIIYNLKRGSPIQPRSSRSFWLLIIPWLVFLIIILELLLIIFLGKHVHLVERAENNFYCHIQYNVPNQVTASLIITSMAILLPLEVWAGAMMYRHWDVFRRLSRTDRQIFLTLYLRLTLCTLGAMIAFTFAMLAFIFPAPDAISIVYPIVPILFAVAFGTQKDILRAWLFWRTPQPYGSIIFNNRTVLTTNIHTSRGVVSESTTGRSTFRDKPPRHALSSGATPSTQETSTAPTRTKGNTETVFKTSHIAMSDLKHTQKEVRLEVSGVEQAEQGAVKIQYPQGVQDTQGKSPDSELPPSQTAV